EIEYRPVAVTTTLHVFQIDGMLIDVDKSAASEVDRDGDPEVPAIRTNAEMAFPAILENVTASGAILAVVICSLAILEVVTAWGAILAVVTCSSAILAVVTAPLGMPATHA